MTRENVIEVDAADLDTGGTIVPKGLSADVNDETLDADAFRLDPNRMDRWAVKVYNNADQDVDATPVVSTSDDKTLAEYDTEDSLTTTVSSGGTVPGSVELVDSDLVAGHLAVELTPAAGATGTVKVVFESRSMG